MEKVGDWWGVSKDDGPLTREWVPPKRGDFTWQKHYPEKIESFLGKDRRVAIDVGANYGFMACAFSKMGFKVHAFEPFTPVFECLEKNVEGFDVTVYNKALSSNVMPIGLISGIDTRRTSGSTKVKFVENSDFKSATLDLYNFKDVDLIKIDVEGHELEVIEGAINTIREYKPLLCIELNQKVDKIENILKEFDYKAVHNHFVRDRIYKAL